MAKPDNTKCLDFLEKFHPNDWWVLTAICPKTGRIDTRTFDNKYDADRWLQAYNGKRNIYFGVNSVLHPISKKTSKKDIKEVKYLHVDIDPNNGHDLDDERDRIYSLLDDKLPVDALKPTAIIFSGGGFQAFWKIKDPIVINGNLESAKDAEKFNKKLEMIFGADHCHNVDRIMRLPGTLNIPNEKKKKNGRKMEMARLIDYKENRTYDLSEFKTFEDAKPIVRSEYYEHKEKVRAEVLDKRDKYELTALDPYKIEDRLKVIIMQGHHPAQPKQVDNSRSANLFDVTCNLLRKSVPDDMIFSIITDSSYKISESVLEKTDSDTYALKQIENAKEVVLPELELKEFITNENGSIKKCPDNIILGIKKLAVTLKYNTFSDSILIEGLKNYGPFLSDAAVDRMYILFQKRFDFKPSKDDFWMIVRDTARENSFHPVCDYLDSLKWDGISRLPLLLIKYFGAKDTVLNKEIAKIILVAAVRRVRKPGCKFDQMLILEGKQGSGKSSALATLAVEENWFTDDFPLNADSKKVIESLQGHWLVEASELNGLKKSEAESFKSMLSRQTDKARLSYDKIRSDVPRQNIIIGTTNADQYLTDSTGNRRFWPVETGQIDLVGLKDDRDQLWAEAAKLEADEMSIFLDENMYQYAIEMQEKRRIDDPWLETLLPILHDEKGKVLKAEIWAILQVPIHMQSSYYNTRLGAVMTELGWKRARRRFDNGKPEVCYVKGSKNEQLLAIRFDKDGRRLRPDDTPF